jgi:hypothetical protein
MIVFDATFAMLLIDQKASVPTDADTGQPFLNARERIEYFLSTCEDRVVIPTPALAECLVGASGNTSELFNKLKNSYRMGIEPFDELAAIEVALMSEAESVSKGQLGDITKAKVKYDRQIIAIAKVIGASTIYSDDANLKSRAMREGIKGVGLGEMSLPAISPQIDMDFPHSEAKNDDE